MKLQQYNDMMSFENRLSNLLNSYEGVEESESITAQQIIGELHGN